MPGHFLIKLEGETPAHFVDCFNGGTILREQDCEQFITASGLAFDPTLLLEKSATPTLLARMLRNLLSIYEQESEEPMARRVRAFLELLENEPLDPESPH